MGNIQYKGQLSLSLRPHTLKDVYGCEFAKKSFYSFAKDNNWPTAMLLQGRFGSGKSTLAFIAAQMMNCEHPTPEGDPCCECPSCKAIMNGTFGPSILFIDGGQAGKDDIIDTVTTFTATSGMPSAVTGKPTHKVVIIDEVQELSQKAKNSMLKLLELTKPNLHFIFTSMDNMSATGFVSRCKLFKFNYASTMDIMYFLKATLEKLGLWDSDEIPQDFKMQGLATIAGNAEGSYRQAIQILQQCIETNTYTEEDIKNNLGLMNIETFSQTLMNIMNGDKSESTFDSIIEGDYNQTFNLAYKVLSDAMQWKTFGHVSGGQFFERQAANIASHKNFEKTLACFKQLSMQSKASYLKKSDYVIAMCELINANSVNEVPLREAIPVRSSTIPTRPSRS